MADRQRYDVESVCSVCGERLYGPVCCDTPTNSSDNPDFRLWMHLDESAICAFAGASIVEHVAPYTHPVVPPAPLTAEQLQRMEHYRARAEARLARLREEAARRPPPAPPGPEDPF